MNDDRDKDLEAQGIGRQSVTDYDHATIASRASGELLDLVRTAEEEATVATRATPSSARLEVSTGSYEAVPTEEFVDVGDDAVDAPPSLPPMRSATPIAGHRPQPLAATPTRALPADSVEEGPRLPPTLAVMLLLALAVGMLALLAR